MAMHGSVGEFNNVVEDWTLESLEQYFAANDIDSVTKQIAIFPSACRVSTYKLMRSLMAPNKPTEMRYGNLVKLMKELFRPSLQSSCSVSLLTAVPARPARAWLSSSQN